MGNARGKTSTSKSTYRLDATTTAEEVDYCQEMESVTEVSEAQNANITSTIQSNKAGRVGTKEMIPKTSQETLTHELGKTAEDEATEVPIVEDTSIMYENKRNSTKCRNVQSLILTHLVYLKISLEYHGIIEHRKEK